LAKANDKTNRVPLGKSHAIARASTAPADLEFDDSGVPRLTMRRRAAIFSLRV
jgi:hypothetical protein